MPGKEKKSGHSSQCNPGMSDFHRLIRTYSLSTSMWDNDNMTLNHSYFEWPKHSIPFRLNFFVFMDFVLSQNMFCYSHMLLRMNLCFISMDSSLVLWRIQSNFSNNKVVIRISVMSMDAPSKYVYSTHVSRIIQKYNKWLCCFVESKLLRLNAARVYSNTSVQIYYKVLAFRPYVRWSMCRGGLFRVTQHIFHKLVWFRNWWHLPFTLRTVHTHQPKWESPFFNFHKWISE